MTRSMLVSPFELKSFDQAKGEFEGLASVYGNEDLAGDIVDAGAFKADIEKNGRKRPFLWQHKWDDPIGSVELYEERGGLRVKGTVDMDIEQGRRAFSSISKRYVTGLSIGYDTIKHKMDGAVRRLQELKLWEVSAVTFPANPRATVTAMKSEEEERALAIANLLAQQIQLLSAASRLKELEQLVARRSHRATASSSDLRDLRYRVAKLNEEARRRFAFEGSGKRAF